VVYLVRPDGWEEEYTDLVAEHNAHMDGRAVSRDRRRVAELERELKTARTKARDAVKRAEAAEAQADARIAESRRDIKKAGRAAAQRAAELEENLADSEQSRKKLADEVAELQSELAALRAQRRGKGKQQASAVDRLPTGFDPITRAQALDDLFNRAQRHHLPPQVPQPDREVLALPAGIAPDRADAVEWLLASGIPQVWIVDGHNLAHRLDPTRFTQPELRSEIADVFTALRRHSAGPLRAVIVFDTGAPVGDQVQASPGVDLIFVGDADSEVVVLAGVHGGESVVVSSDREVRLGAAESGAVVIWSEAIVDFLRR